MEYYVGNVGTESSFCLVEIVFLSAKVKDDKQKNMMFLKTNKQKTRKELCIHIPKVTNQFLENTIHMVMGK